MGKSNKRESVKSNRRGPPRVKNRDSNEAVGITVEEVVEKIETILAPTVQMKPKRKNKETN
jgi:hypothetical protein